MSQNDLAMADLFQNILDDKCVIDITTFSSGGIYHGKAALNANISVDVNGASVSEMIFNLHKEIQNTLERN